METKKLLLFVAFVLAAGSAYCCGEDCDCCDWAEEVEEVQEKRTEPAAEATKPVVVAAKEEENKEEESKPEVAPEPTVKLAKNEEEIEEFDPEAFAKFAKELQEKGVETKKT